MAIKNNEERKVLVLVDSLEANVSCSNIKMYVHVKKIKVSYSLSSLCNLLRGQSMTNCHIGTNTNAFLLDTKKEKNP